MLYAPNSSYSDCQMKSNRHTNGTKAGEFRLPKNVTITQQKMPNGSIYVFKDAKLGDLGRLLVEAMPNGETRIASEVTSFPGDPFVERRIEIFGPLSKKLMSLLAAECEGNQSWH